MLHQWIQIKELFYVTFGMIGYSYIKGTACEPAYSESNLNFRIIGLLQKLDTVRKVTLLEQLSNVQFPLGPTISQINCGIDLCYIKSVASETLLLWL